MKNTPKLVTLLVILSMLVVGCTTPAAPSSTQSPSAPVPAPTSPVPAPTSPVPTPTPIPTPLPPSPTALTGTLEVYVTDAPTDNISNIWVTFQEIAVHSANQTADEDENQGEEGDWIPITFTDNQTFDLLELGASDLEALLAADNLTAGKYTQLRVIIGEVKVTVGSANITAILPSGKLKFVRPFEVFPDDTTTIVMDFDARKSVVRTGSGKYIVKPVVQLSVQQGDKAHQLTWVKGTISAVDTKARSVSILPTGGSANVTLDVNPQKTEIILDDDEASLNDLAEAVDEHGVNTVNATASYYPNNLKAVTIDALSPQGE